MRRAIESGPGHLANEGKASPSSSPVHRKRGWLACADYPPRPVQCYADMSILAPHSLGSCWFSTSEGWQAWLRIREGVGMLLPFEATRLNCIHSGL